MEKLKIGYVPLIKASWLTDKLETRRQSALKALSAPGAEIIEPGELIMSAERGEAALEKFEDEKVDAIIAHYITFSMGSIIPGMAARLRVPVIFWSEPEPPMNGGRIESNSFCAVNMNAHALWEMGLKYDFVHGSAKTAIPEIRRRLKVIECVKKLRSVRVGVAGGRVPGFYTSNFDELAIREKFGSETETLTLLELVKHAESVTDKRLKSAMKELLGGCARGNITEDETRKGAALLAAFQDLTEKHRLDAWTVRCWPELSDLYGIGVCHLLGCLTGAGVPAACEGDVYGALAMLITKFLTGESSFFCDLISFEPDGDEGLFWHCGAAPVDLRKKGACPTLGKHSIIDGGGKKGIVCEFPLKPGPVTVLRIGETKNGGYRLLTISGEALDTQQLLKGNPLRVRFNRNASELAETLIESGFEHHYVMARGDIAKDMKFFAKLLDLELLQL